MYIRQFRQIDSARIGNDELGAFIYGISHMPADDGMRFSGIGTDSENGIGVVQFIDGIGHSAAAERDHEPCDARCVTSSGAVIYVVGAQDHPSELLEEIVLLICAAR